MFSFAAVGRRSIRVARRKRSLHEGLRSLRMAGGPDDPRLGNILQFAAPDCIESNAEKRALVLVGFPHDEGVRRNNGRVGARNGPSAVRQYIKKMGCVVNPELGVDLKQIGIFDTGDVGVGAMLEDGHAELTEHVKTLLSRGCVPFVVGGGNDQSYPNASALLASGKRVAVINVDAHLDVRPLVDGQVHSGSPFRLLLQDDRFRGEDFVEFACQGNQCSVDHANYVAEKGGRCMWLRDLRSGSDPGRALRVFTTLLDELAASVDHIFLSFDLDAVSGADAPGVSAPGTVGLTAQEALDMCLAAGAHPKVALMDVSELNPLVEDYRSPRLVVNMFYFFACGLVRRV